MKLKLLLIALATLSLKCSDDQTLVSVLLPGSVQDDQILPEVELQVNQQQRRDYLIAYCAKCKEPILSSQAYTKCGIPEHDHTIHVYHQLECGNRGKVMFQRSSYPRLDTDEKLRKWMKDAKLPGCEVLTEEAQAELFLRAQRMQPKFREDARRALRCGSLIGASALPCAAGFTFFILYLGALI